MSAQFVIHVPKATEMYQLGEDEAKALEESSEFVGEDDYDVVTVFRVEGDIKTPIAFFWKGQKFIPQTPVDKSL